MTDNPGEVRRRVRTEGPGGRVAVVGDWGSAVLGALLLVLAALTAGGLVRVALHRPRPASGDPDLASSLDEVTGRRTRRLAAVIVDLTATPPRRTAFVDAAADTRFEIGSVGKGLTGLLVRDAIDRGELTADTTLADLAPRYRGRPVGDVTVEQLGTHTSGLPPLPRSPQMLLRVLAGQWFGLDPYRGLTADDTARAAARQRLGPAGHHVYSNLGAAVLGNAVAEHLGTTYGALLVRRVLEPLGMSATSASGGPGTEVRRGWTARGRRSLPWRPSGYAPAGDVTSTADDVALLLEALVRGDAPGAGATTPLAAGPGGSAQAMFWLVDTAPGSDRTMVWHNGQTGGYSAFVAAYPQARRAVAVLSDVADARQAQRVAAHLVRRMVARGS